MAKILMIDDDEYNLISYSALLKRFIPDCMVTTSTSGAEGVLKAKEELPDTILLDVQMPEMDGFEVCRSLKSDEATTFIPIIMMTGALTDLENRIKGLEIGADAFLAKPVAGPELVAQVRVMLRIRRSEDLLRKQRDHLENKVRDRTRALQKEEIRFRSLFEQSNDAIFIHNFKREILDVNGRAVELLGYAREQLRSMTIPMIKPPGTENQTRGGLDQLLEKGYARFETEFLRADGRKIYVEISSRILDGKEGIIQGIARDITERKRVERELIRAKEKAEAANRAKSEFLANMSHEIRTPMNGVIGMLGLTLETDLTPEQHEFLSVAKTSADALLRLIDDVLDLSKIEAGKLEIVREEMILQDIIQSVIDPLALRAQEKGLEVFTTIQRDVPMILLGDPGRLRQILLNLLGNAIKFTEAGKIDIGVEVEEREEKAVVLHFWVKDSGIGIPENRREDIFNAFTQVDGSLNRKYGGTGLGLGICGRLVKMMGGRIWVESRQGWGSIFHFTIKLGIDTAGAPDLLPANQRKEEALA